MTAILPLVPDAPETESETWMIVDSISPLRLRRDSGAVINAAVNNLVGPLLKEDRVLVRRSGRRLTIYGPSRDDARLGPLETAASQAATAIAALVARPQAQLTSGGGWQGVTSAGGWVTYTAWGDEPLGRIGGVTYSHPYYVVPVAGIYLLTAGARFVTSSNGGRVGMRFLVNNVTNDLRETVVPSVGGGIQTSAAPYPAVLNAGDTVRLQVFQDVQTTLNVDRTWLSLLRVN